MAAPLILVLDDNAELVELLAGALEDHGYRTAPFHRGKAAVAELEGGEKPALAIIDLLLPDMTGYDVSKACAKHGVPFFFVTGVFKGGRHSLEAARKYECKGYFEKPFDAEKLLEAVQRLVPPPPPSERKPKVPDVDLSIDVDVSEYTPASPMELTGRIEVSGDNISAVLSGKNLALQSPTAASSFMRPARTPPPGTLQAPVEPLPPVEDDPRVRRGHLRDNLPQLITAFWQGQQTGEIVCARGKVRKSIVFEKGNPVFAASNLAADRYGAFLVRIGKINEAQLKTAALAAGAQRRRTGDVLIELGLLKETERMYYVAQQVKAIVYSLFAWEEGEYLLRFTDKAKHEPIRLGIHPAHLIARGIKKLYKAERLQRILGLEERLMPAPDPPFQLGELELDGWEAQLVSRVTGERNVAELIALSGKPAPTVLASLVALLGVKVLDRRPE